VEYFRCYQRLTEHWRSVLPADRFIEVDYEELTRTPEPIIGRIIFLDGIPSVEVGLKPQLGSKVQEQIEIDLKDELDAVRQYNDAVKLCAEAKDDGSKSLFESMIRDEERHADFLEAQLHAIKAMGIANYLSQQIGSGT